jgi:hypothetical protein
VMEVMRDAFALGVLRGMVKVANPYNVLFGSYPEWSKKLPEGSALPARVKAPSPHWSTNLVIFGINSKEVNMRLSFLRKALGPVTEALMERPARRAKLSRTDPYLGGQRSDATALAYWRHPRPLPKTQDLRRDRRGALFCAPVIPLEGKAVRRAIRLFEDHCFRAGFEPCITLNVSDARSVSMIGAIYFDRRGEGADARALKCHHLCVRALAREGFLPYRLSTASMESIPPRDGATDDLLRRLRRAWDPAGILASGRYVP